MKLWHREWPNSLRNLTKKSLPQPSNGTTAVADGEIALRRVVVLGLGGAICG